MKESLSKGKLFAVSMIVMMILALESAHTFVKAEDPSKYETWGPRVDNILIKIYGTYEAEVSDFLNGQVDIMDWPLDKDTYDTIKTNPNYVVEPLTMYDYYDIDINNLRWPTSDVNFRRAMAYLVDYEEFYTTVLRAYSGQLMDSIVQSELTEWYNPDAAKYYYDTGQAAAILDAAGYQDWDSDGLREYKNATDTYELPSLIFYARADDPARKSLGDMLNQELGDIGIPVDYNVADADVCSQAAYETYNYNLYTAGAGPFNDPEYLYDYYHSQFGIGWPPSDPWAPNNVFFTNSTYDYWAEQLKFASDRSTAVEACMKCQEVLMDQVPLIPIYHSAGSTAYRTKYGHWAGEEPYWDKPWKGILNAKRSAGINTGVNDWWTLLDAHPEGIDRGGVLREGAMSDAVVVNPVMQYWYWDGLVLGPVYDQLMRYEPEAGMMVPWLAKNWTVETWDNGGQPATKLTLKIFDNVKWHDGQPLTSEDVAFTMKYMYDAGSPLYYANMESIDQIDQPAPHIETPDPLTVVIYFSVESIWSVAWVGTVPIIPKHVWESIPPDQCEAQGEYVTTGNLTGSGPYVIGGHTEGQNWVLNANTNYFRFLKGDVTADGVVDIFDIVTIAVVFGSEAGDPGYNLIADINHDGYVDIFDIVIVATSFGNSR